MPRVATTPVLTTKPAPRPKPSWLRRLSAVITQDQPLLTFSTIALTMFGVCLISLYVLIDQSLRLDESQSLWQTSHSPGGTLRVVAQDVHVPLYHMILHFWQLFFGNGVFTARLLSMLFFLITIPLVYALARQVLTKGWALFAMVVFSFLPFMNWYGNEARMYTLLAMMATLSQLFFVRIIKGKKISWPAYGITSVIGVYSHYFFSFNLMTQGIFYLINRRSFAKGTFKRLVIVAGFVVAAFAPWLLYFRSLGSGENTSPLLPNPSSVDFFNAFSQFIFGFQDDRINTILVSGWPLVVILAFLAIKRGQRISTELSYIITAAFVPVILAFLLSYVVSPFFLSRYMISSVAPLIILVIWLISHYGRRAARVASVAIVIMLLLTSWRQDFSSATPVRENYRPAAVDIAQRVQPDDVVVLAAPFTVYPFEYYYNASAQIRTLPDWDRQSAGAIPAFNKATMPDQVKELSRNHRYAYLLLSQDQGDEETIRQYFLHNYPLKSQHTYSPNLTLYVFQVGFDQVPALGSAQTRITAKEAASYTAANSSQN